MTDVVYKLERKKKKVYPKEGLSIIQIDGHHIRLKAVPIYFIYLSSEADLMLDCLYFL